MPDSVACDVEVSRNLVIIFFIVNIALCSFVEYLPDERRNVLLIGSLPYLEMLFLFVQSLFGRHQKFYSDPGITNQLAKCSFISFRLHEE